MRNQTGNCRFNISGGYTLVESVVCLVLVGFLLTLTLPCFVKTAGSYRLRIAARQLAADLRETRARALTEDTFWYVRFYPDINAYRIYKSGTAGTLRTVSLSPPVQLVAAEFGSSGGLLYFNGDGVPNAGGSVSLAVGEREWRYVIVTPVTGRVRVDTVPPP